MKKFGLTFNKSSFGTWINVIRYYSKQTRLLINKKTEFDTYLCGPNDIGVNVKKIANLVKKIFKSEKKILYGKQNFGWEGDVPFYQYKVSRLNKEGFRFEKSSLMAVEEAIKKNSEALANEKY